MNPDKIISPQDLAATYDRILFRDALATEDNTVSGAEIVGSAECQAEYDAVLADYDQASARLLDAMDAHPDTGNDSGNIRKFESWHYDQRSLPDGRTLPVAYAVSLSSKGGRPSGYGRYGDTAVITVDAFAVHTPGSSYQLAGYRKLTGRHAGEQICDTDSERVSLSATEVRIRPHNAIHKGTLYELHDKGRYTAMADWAGDFMAVCGQPDDNDDAESLKKTANLLGLKDDDKQQKPVIDLLLRTPQTLDEAQAILAAGLDPSVLKQLAWVLSWNSTSALNAVMEGYGQADRLAWLQEHYVAMHTQADVTILHTVNSHYRQRFMAELEVERRKTAELRELAECLERMELMNDSAPQ